MADLKPVRWLGTTRDDICAQRPKIRDELGQQLFRVQMGLMPNNYKPMSTVGAGVYEIRVQDADGIARLMYVAKFNDVVYVLHVFTKKSKRTPRIDIDLAKKRYREARDG
ncbi:type II toxin-antitoxin system RelE/ParE family toxin [Mycolicibacterium sp. GF69]|uniref:type II toxin-antitoxin system RelE/ParE family toxin n=1 Tax=Mycolicibacterium sp. GF69 TaxID=2267251 RepID=UPI000DCDEDFF|nr:type II toxin-antitoxin system RelE/ParE family toxin [Mycolicibacterium sp. GF69]RAV17254.1 type II toxin-antitoxin system RelE/ParE family toxin [Mycolicibacterium sp. GF69]